MRHLLSLFIILIHSTCFGWGSDAPHTRSQDTVECNLTSQDFTTYTETDPNSLITKNASTITFDVTPIPTAKVFKDFGAGYFDGDLTVRFSVNLSVFDIAGNIYPIALTNSTATTLFDLGGDWVYIRMGGNGTTRFIRLTVENAGTLSEDGSNFAPVAGTTYFFTFKRNFTGGANGTGQYITEIRTGSNTGTLLDTLTRDVAAGESHVFQYLYAFSSYESESGSYAMTGTISNMEVGECF